MIVKPDTYFDATYDVIVLGFGGAGATAARFAADAGAKVLLVDSAPEGHEGGNTRYCMQYLATNSDINNEKQFYKGLTYPFFLDNKMIDTFAEGSVNLPKYLKKYLGVKPFSFKKNSDEPFVKTLKAFGYDEYPEIKGEETNDTITVHKGVRDSALWTILRQEILKRSQNIDVWYASPARHLIKGNDDKTIVGVQIEREHVLRNIKAKNGVVIATGGFENNEQMKETYLNQYNLAPFGSLYNKGDGIKIAIEADADLWHMNKYIPGSTVTFKIPKGHRAHLVLGWPFMNHGSIFTAGDDGSRYTREDEPGRHGYIYFHGSYRQPPTQYHPHLVFDYRQYKKLDKTKLPFPEVLDNLIKADNLKELAKKIKADPKILEQTVSDFNFFVKQKRDFTLNRNPKTMQIFSQTGPYYAIPMQHNITNTQGGPKRNSNAQIIDTYNRPIPHLYGAGELGHLNANEYVGGQDMADNLIFGKIAGQNAAHPKDDYINQESFSDKMPKVPRFQSQNQTASNIAWGNTKKNFPTGKNQYIGRSNSGMGDEIVVRITTSLGNSLKNIEVLKESESKDYGLKAIQKLPDEMVKQNTYKVDSISGATVSSRGLKDAVKDAMNKIPTVQKD